MIDVSFEISGYDHASDLDDDNFFLTLLEEIKTSIRKSLSPFRCQKHGGRPRVVVKMDRMHRLSFDIKGCCNDLVDRVREKLG